MIARTEWLYSCVRYTVQPDRAEGGTPIDPFTVDEPQLERADGRDFVREQAVIPEPRGPEAVATTPGGGPTPRASLVRSRRSRVQIPPGGAFTRSSGTGEHRRS